MSVAPVPTEIESAILALTTARVAGSICPSEVARALGGTAWRPLLGPVRAAAVTLARAGRIEILRKGRPIPPEAMRGVIRLRAPARTG
jgi:hypothetical protein